jgi:putative flippase GtrA
LLTRLRHIILGIIDFFHWPFSRWIPAQTFRYLACGGSNTLLNIFLYFISYNFFLHGHDLVFYGGIRITARVVAWLIAFSISFPIGFTLSRHIVFPESNLHGRVQFFRYVLTTVTFILMSYLLIKFFAIFLYFIPPTISYTFVNIITAVLSYISQRVYTFKTVDQEIEEEVVPD